MTPRRVIANFQISYIFKIGDDCKIQLINQPYERR